MQHQSTFLAAGDNRVSTFPAKKNKTKQKNNTNATGGFMSSVSRGLANQAVYFFEIFLSTRHSKMIMQCSFRCWLMLLQCTSQIEA